MGSKKLAQDRNQWLAALNMVTGILVPQKAKSHCCIFCFFIYAIISTKNKKNPVHKIE
jgi:hypothetical protein